MLNEFGLRTHYFPGEAERDMNELSVVQGPTCGAEPGELIEPEIDEEQWAAVDPLDDVAILRNFYEQHPG